MKVSTEIANLGFSHYEFSAYLALLGKHPINGSQLSRRSGIPRAKIYDVLFSLKEKGFVVEAQSGLYVPLPPEEMLKRLRSRFEIDLAVFEKRLKSVSGSNGGTFVWTIRGNAQVFNKAREMIASSRTDIYVRFFPEESQILDSDLIEAASRGVVVKYVSMGNPTTFFDYQVIHPGAEKIEGILGGRTIDIVVDKKEVLVGMIAPQNGDESSVNWTKNHFLVIANRDSLRHDFYHYFLYKIHEKKQNLTKKEKRLYVLIKNDL
jgi:HTH-type transcriptional regulator, sugar sensing transcriptional regulator